MFAFENPKPGRVVRQIDAWVGGFPPMMGLGEKVHAAVDHLQRDRREGLIQFFGYGVRQVDQDGIQQPGGPQLKLDTVLGADPEVGQAHSAKASILADILAAACNLARFVREATLAAASSASTGI